MAPTDDAPEAQRHRDASQIFQTAYVDQAYTRRGIGIALYGELFAKLRDQSIHAVIAGISFPNPASVSLHERLGFRKVAHFSEVGFKLDRWVDVGYWQTMLSSA
ncbi:MAG TPA: GNAT family N-acetyltransferase [Xanthomonadaceae bacterium]|jgi:L-amino acid N-acyltransferase YncA|nr:GNAT family N-acetyltransferase [Xanthomonadaceae bacterium]